jgi:outer membrane protein assembly factor BamB
MRLLQHTHVLSFSLWIGLLWLSAASVAGDWPHWRGPDRDDVSKETGLLKSWPQEGPPRLWVNGDVGIGYSGFAIVGGKLFTMGARGETEFLLCLNVADGKELWSAEIGPLLTNGYGDGPRGTPSVDGDRVYGMGGQGTLISANIADGKVLWTKSMTDLGGRKPGWGFCESVLVDGDRVVCTPGGRNGAIVSLDKLTGEVKWQSSEVTEGAQYASIVPVEHNGQRQYIQLFMNSLVGVAADSGKLLWKTDWPGRTAVIPTPIFHDGHVFVTSGYGVGCKLVKVGPDNQVSEVYFSKNMQNHHGGVVRVGDHLYGHSDRAWVCLDFKTGEIVWSERSALGKGALTVADGMLYCQSERDGEIVLAEASPTGWKEHGRFKLEAQSHRRSSRGRVWTHPVVSNGKLFLRDQEFLSCYDVQSR